MNDVAEYRAGARPWAPLAARKELGFVIAALPLYKPTSSFYHPDHCKESQMRQKNCILFFLLCSALLCGCSPHTAAKHSAFEGTWVEVHDVGAPSPASPRTLTITPAEISLESSLTVKGQAMTVTKNCTYIVTLVDGNSYIIQVTGISNVGGPIPLPHRLTLNGDTLSVEPTDPKRVILPNSTWKRQG